MEYIILIAVIAGLLLGAAVGLVVSGKRRKQLPPTAPQKGALTEPARGPAR
jgi:fused signal recognition particle receptor